MYEARDELLDELVAVKVVSLRSEDVSLLKREFRLLETLRHRNVVRARELVVAESVALVTMDLVHGVAIDRYVAAVRGTPEFVPTIRRCMRGLFQGLQALHTQGIAHRDVKPANVLVDVHAEVKLVDLGLARDVGSSPLRPPSGLIGTVGYMAPEQIWGTDAGPAVDLFAAGTILLELLIGRLPRAAEPSRFSSGLPELSLETASAVSPELAGLAAKLLAPDPTARPSIDTVLTSLGDEGTPIAGPVFGFVGRDREVGVLETSARRSRSEPAVALVRGNSGMGKTTLVREVLRMLATRGAQVFRHRCHPSETVSFQTIDGIVEGVAAALPPEDLPGGGSAALGALARAFPSLAGQLGAPSAATGDLRASPDALQEAGQGLARLLAALAAKVPVSVWIDDLQWADTDSTQVLRAAVRAAGPGVWWVFSTRDQPERGVELAKEVSGDIRLDELALSPLPLPLCLEWARRVYPERDHDTLSRLVQNSQGWPLYLTELLSEPDQEPEGEVHDLLTRRVHALSERSRRILELVSTAPGPIAVELLNRLTATPAGSELSELLDRRFLSWATGGPRPTVTTYHDAVREAVTARLDASARSELHRALLGVYRGTAPAGLLFHLCLGAGELEEAREFGVQALRDALDTYAYDRAVVLATLLLRLPNIDPLRFEILRGRAIGLVGTGRGLEAGRQFLEAAALAPNELQDLVMRRRAAEELLGAGAYEEGTRVLRPLLDDHGVPRPRSGMAGLMMVLWLQSKAARLRAKKLQLPRQDERDEERLRFLWGAGAGVGLSDSIAAFQLQFRHALAAEEAGSEAHRAMALVTESVNHHWEGGTRKLAEGARVLSEGRRLAERSGSSLALAQTRLAEVIRLFLGRRFSDALEGARQGERYCLESCPESPWHLASFRWFIAHSLPMEFRFGEARRWLPERIHTAAEHSDQYLLLNLRVGRPNLVHLAAGDPETCQQGLAWVKDNLGSSPYFYYAWVLARIWLELYEGRAHEALAVIDASRPVLEKKFVFRMQAFRIEFAEVEILTLAALAVKEGPNPGWAKRAKKRLAQIAAEDAPWTAPYVERLGASLALLQGREALIVEHTERARIGFEQLGIKLHARLARAALDGDAGLERLHAEHIEAPRAFASIWHPWLARS